ncbi:MAG: hypothetical protein QOF48_1938 [Verrucomicrobiota bacterium]|jgi:probable phosphoglycerate mutase
MSPQSKIKKKTATMIYFLRHGQTASSRDNVFCGGASDPPLTAAGMEMAEAFAQKYSSLPWAAVFSSPQLRAISTATPLCKEIGMESVILNGLREIGYGQWEGKTSEEVRREFPEDHSRWNRDPCLHAPTGGETALEVERRALQALQEIKNLFSSGNVLVVSHKATIRVLLCSLLGIEIGKFRHRLGCPVASVSTVEFLDTGPMLNTLADRSHLRESLRMLPGT